MAARTDHGWITLEALAALGLLLIALAGAASQHRQTAEVIRKNRQTLSRISNLPGPVNER